MKCDSGDNLDKLSFESLGVEGERERKKGLRRALLCPKCPRGTHDSSEGEEDKRGCRVMYECLSMPTWARSTTTLGFPKTE